jgi:hypothetical protein
MSQQSFNSDGGFSTAGNITANNITGANAVSTGNISLSGGRINGGNATVVADGINSIALALGAQMDLFGFPFSGGLTRGQLTITGNISTTQALGTWYYQSVNSYTYQLYTDSTYSALVDATGWTAYAGGGTVDITLQSPAANIVINSNGFTSTFANTGAVTLPGTLDVDGNITGAAGVFNNGLSVTGNITATGNLNYQNVNDLVVGDPLIFIGANNTSDIVDLGIIASANVSGTPQHLGIVRNHLTGVWGVFGNVIEEPTTVVDWANAVYQPFQAGAITAAGGTFDGNLSGSNLNTSGLVAATGNITGGNLNTAGRVVATGNITGGNVTTAGLVSATGNITASGNVSGSNLVTAGRVVATGNIVGGNLSGTNITGTLTTAAQTNITSVGTLTSLSVTGNVAGGNVTTAGQVVATGNITATGNVTGGNLVTAGRAVVTGNVVATGNVTGGNLTTAGLVSATGNVTGGNLTTAGLITATGNVTGGNLTTAGLVSATGNITATGNVTGGNITTAGRVVVAGNVAATGNVSGNFFIGNGSQLTGITTTYGNANVVANLAALGANPITSTGNITTTGNVSVGNIIGASANVDIVAGTYDWTFDNTGNLTLPGNVINVKYANTTAVPFIGVPSWTDGGIVTFSGTGNDPTFPTSGVEYNKIYYRQIGPKTWQVQGKYQTSTTSGGNNGVGSYIVRLPASLQFDTTLVTQGIYNPGTSSSVVWPYLAIPESNARYYFSGTSESGWNGGVVPYSSTQYRVITGINGGSLSQPWGQSFAPVTLNNLVILWSFTFQAA